MNLYIDFGGTNFKYCLDDGDVKTVPSNNVDILKFIDDMILAGNCIENIAISFAGQVKNGIILSAPNINLQNLDIKNYVFEKYKINLLIENDLNCAAAYEYSKYDVDSVAVFYVGTGFGSAFVVNGKILSGYSNLSGEIGHIPFKKMDKNCPCGRDDCLELSVSGKALNDKKLQDCDEITIQRFKDGLKHAFFTVLNLLDPDVFVLGGSVITHNIWLVDFLKEEYKNSSFFEIRNDLQIFVSDSKYGNIEGLKILLKDKNAKISNI